MPAAGYDGEGFSGSFPLGNYLNYRLEDRTKLVLKAGAKVPASHPAFGGNPAGEAKPLRDLLLELSPGDYASYTLRDHSDGVQVTLLAQSEEGADLQVSCGEQTAEVRVPAGKGEQALPALTLPAAEVSRVKVEALSGTAQLSAVRFD